MNSMTINSVSLGGFECSSGADGFRKVLQDLLGRLPADAGVRDADTLLQSRRSLWRNLLVALVDVGLDHDADDRILTRAQLVGNVLGHERLVLVVLLGVSVRAVDHENLALVLVAQGLAGGLDAVAVVVGALAATTQDHESVLVARGLGDGGQTLLGDAQEVVRVGGSLDSVNGNTQIAISAVLESDGEAQTRGEFTVQLGLGGAGTDGAQRDEIGQVLGRNGVEHLARDGHAHAGEIGVELTRNAQTFVDVVGLVEVRIVDQTFPSHGRTRLLQVGAHDDAEVGGKLVREGL